MNESVRGKLRILHFDIETRKVGFHTGGRFAPDGCEPTAIAYSWAGERQILSFVLGTDYRQDDDLLRATTTEDLLLHFLAAYEAADIVTGHYVRKFDLP